MSRRYPVSNKLILCSLISDSLNSFSVYNVDKDIFPLSAVHTTNTYAVQRRGSKSEVLKFPDNQEQLPSGCQ